MVALVSGSATAATNQPADSLTINSQNIKYTLTSDQRQQVEASWMKALASHTEKLSVAFDEALPDDYQGFERFRTNEWESAFNRDRDMALSGLERFTESDTLEFNHLRNIQYGFVSLQSVAKYMNKYLETGDKSYLKEIKSRLTKLGDLFESEK